MRLKLFDAPEAADDEDDDKEKGEVCEKRVEAEKDEDDEIVGGIVAEIVVHPRLSLAKTTGFGDELKIEELRQRPEVFESRADCL